MEVKIIFTRNDSWISKVIRYVTKSEISHVSVLVDTALGDNMLLDVTFNGYKIVPLEQFLENGQKIIKCFKIKHDLSRGIKVISRWLNRPYDYKGLLSFISIFNRIFQTQLDNPMDNPKEVICSEVVTIMLQRSGFPGSERLVPKKTSPEDLYLFLLESVNSDPERLILEIEA